MGTLSLLSRRKAATGLSALQCPAWCERTDHHADVVDPKNPAVHYGPEFAKSRLLVATQGRGAALEAVICYDGGEESIADPTELRMVAEELLAAAEWLEANG